MFVFGAPRTKRCAGHPSGRPKAADDTVGHDPLEMFDTLGGEFLHERVTDSMIMTVLVSSR
jgi:hypothetical protein